MKRKFFSVLVSAALLFSHLSVAYAQLDTTEPTTEATAPVTEPTVSEPEPTPEPAPEETVEETVAPPADTTGPAFISVATASAQETEVTVVWTTDEPAFGYVEYGETASYGQATPKSATVAMDHTVSVTGLTPGTSYHYRIVAEDELGNKSYSKDRTFDTAVEIVAIDNVPPEISQISVTNSTTSGATITWTTDELAQGKIEYGKTAEYGAASDSSTDYATDYSVGLTALESNTEYHFRVIVKDESGNEAVSPDEIFTTDAVIESAPVEEPQETEATSTPSQTETTTSTTSTTKTTPTTSTTPTTTTPTNSTSSPAPAFAISEVETATITTSTATIVWRTNQIASAQVFYGVTENYASSSALIANSATTHQVKLTNLKPGTNYFYKVVSQNSAGQKISKNGFSFNTLFKQKVAVAPTISNIKLESISTSTAVIIFTTDMPAGGQINFSTSTAYEDTDGGHQALLTEHRHPLAGLLPDTEYNFETVVWNEAGNQSIFENVSFKTLTATIKETAPVSPPVQHSNPAPVPTGGGSGSGGRRSFSPPVRPAIPTVDKISQPRITKVDPLDKQVLFVWRAAAAGSGLKTTIVRSVDGFVSSPDQGTHVYTGNIGRFADINLENNTTYFYSVFRVNDRDVYSAPLHFRVAPQANKTQTKIIATPAIVQKTPIYVFPRVLKRGDANKHVEHLQVVLASELTIYPRGLITGYFGPLTENAIKVFQKRHQLSVTGRADMTTLAKLEKVSSIAVANDKAAAPDATLTRNLRFGMRGDDVKLLQQFLVKIGFYPETVVTGYFGPLTRAAVQRFQRQQNISPASGYFGPITKKRMLNLIRLESVVL